MKKYNVIATDNRYYVTEGETKEIVHRNVSKDFALKEARRIRNANFWGTAWVEDKEGNVIKK